MHPTRFSRCNKNECHTFLGLVVLTTLLLTTTKVKVERMLDDFFPVLISFPMEWKMMGV